MGGSDRLPGAYIYTVNYNGRGSRGVYKMKQVTGRRQAQPTEVSQFKGQDKGY